MRTNTLGIMGSDPTTGECIAAFSGDVPVGEQAALLARGAIFQRRPLIEVKNAFCEKHPSRRIQSRGPVVGRYRDHDIHEWIEMADGFRYYFASTCGGAVMDLTRLTSGQLATAPGLVFELVVT